MQHVSFSEIAQSIGTALGKSPTQPEGILAKINQTLQPELNEMFFARRLILVEGREDLAYILTYLNLMEKLDEYRRLGCHIVPASGKNQLLQPVTIARHLRIPTYLVFDADADETNNSEALEKHRKDNSALLNLANSPDADALPDQDFWDVGITLWRSNIGSVVQSEIGRDTWNESSEQARQRYGNVGSLQKNALHIAATLTLSWEAGQRSQSLERLCEEILSPNNALPHLA